MAKYGIREVTDMVFKAKSAMSIGAKTFATGQPVLVIDSAKSSTLEGASTTVYAQGGRGNPRRIAWDGEKTLTFKFQDALISPITASILMGAGLSEDTPYAQHVFGYVTCTTAGTLDCTGLVEDSLFLGAGSTAPTAFTAPVWVTKVTDGEMAGTAEKVADVTKINAIAVTAAVQGDQYMVDGYVTTTKGTSLKITPDKFAGSFEIVASTLWRRESDGVDVPAQITIPNGKVKTAFTLTQSPTGDPSTFDFEVDALADYMSNDTSAVKKKVLCQIDVLG